MSPSVIQRVIESGRTGSEAPGRRRAVPVGETREIRVDVAVVLATNQDLDQAVRERPWDIPLLLDHYRRHHERKQRKPTLGFIREALRALIAYDWPGSVRELARACSLFVIHARPGAWIDPALLDTCLPDLRRKDPNPKAGPLLGESVPMRDAVHASSAS